MYANISAGLRTRLDRVLNSCIKFIYNLRKYDHIGAKKKDLDFLTNDLRRTFHYATMIYKVQQTQNPPYLFEKLNFPTHSYNTRRKDTLVVPQHKTKAYEGSFTFMSSKVWNSVPQSLRQAKTVGEFKSGYRDMIVNNAKL